MTSRKEVKLEVNTEKFLQDMWGVISKVFGYGESEFEVRSKIRC